MRYCGGKVPSPGGGPKADAPADARTTADSLRPWLDSFELQAIAVRAMDLFRAANLAAEEEKTWKLAKDPAKKDELYASGVAAAKKFLAGWDFAAYRVEPEDPRLFNPASARDPLDPHSQPSPRMDDPDEIRRQNHRQ